MTDLSPDRRAILQPFGERVKARCQQLGISAADVSRACGAQRTWLSNIVAAERDTALTSAVLIGRVLRVPLGVLLGEQDIDTDMAEALAVLREMPPDARRKAVQVLRALK